MFLEEEDYFRLALDKLNSRLSNQTFLKLFASIGNDSEQLVLNIKQAIEFLLKHGEPKKEEHEKYKLLETDFEYIIDNTTSEEDIILSRTMIWDSIDHIIKISKELSGKMINGEKATNIKFEDEKKVQKLVKDEIDILKDGLLKNIDTIEKDYKANIEKTENNFKTQMDNIVNNHDSFMEGAKDSQEKYNGAEEKLKTTIKAIEEDYKTQKAYKFWESRKKVHVQCLPFLWEYRYR